MSTNEPNRSLAAPRAAATVLRSDQGALAHLHDLRARHLDHLDQLIHSESDPRERAKLHVAVLREVARAEAAILRRDRHDHQLDLADRHLALAAARATRTPSRPASHPTPSPSQIANLKSASCPPAPSSSPFSEISSRKSRQSPRSPRPTPPLPDPSALTAALLKRAGTPLSSADLAPVIAGLRVSIPAVFAQLARAP